APGQAWHAGEHPADVDQQQVSDHLMPGEPCQAFLARAGEDGLPEQDGGQYRQKAQYRAQQEVATIGHALDERGAEDIEILPRYRPPSAAGGTSLYDARHEWGGPPATYNES